MSRNALIKGALVILLVGAALIGRPASGMWVIVGLLTFGVFNVLVSAPGTESVRAVAIAGAFGGLLWPSGLLAIVLVLAWILWPPAFAVSWALSRKASGTPSLDPQEREAAARRARIGLAALIAAVSIGSAAYRLIVANRLDQTAALFIGIPALLAIVVVLAVSPHSAKGVACKAVTVGLLVSVVFLWEGVLCVLMSAPLFYAVALATASAMEWGRRNENTRTRTTFSCLVLLAVVPMSLEGVTGFTTFSRDESVAVSRIVRASPDAIERALFEAPRFDRVLPLYLRAGFPWPVSTRIERHADGMRWVIQLRGGEMRLNGMEPRAGDLVLELEEARPGLVRWRAVSDSSHMTHFLTWREVVVEWKPVDAHTTNVTWTLRYRRGLDPAWYFGPWERYAARLAAGYLIEAVATP